MTMQFDPHPGPPFVGYGRRRPAWWETWAVLAACVAVVVLGWLIGGR